jgi:P27 family predicted phage terminase small subunit
MSGPVRKPTKLQLLHGNPRMRTLSDREPNPEQESKPEPPSHISEEAKEIWNARAPLLARLGLLTIADKDAFTEYCEVMVQWIKAKQFVEKNGTSYYVHEDYRDGIDDNGNFIIKKRLKYVGQFPEVSIFRGLTQVLRALRSEFGMTPAARTRIEVDASFVNKPEDDFQYHSRSA